MNVNSATQQEPYPGYWLAKTIQKELEGFM